MNTAASSFATDLWSRRLLLGQLAAALALTSACAATTSAAPPTTTMITTAAACGDGALAIRGEVDEVGAVARVATRACARVAAAGLVAGDVDVVIHDDAFAFAAATGEDTDTLRAWSRYGRIHLMTRASWQRRDDVAVARRLTHELCHVALWRRCGSEAAARAAKMPRAWVEGVCSVVADQGADRVDKASVVAELGDGRVVDFEGDSTFAYAVAHHVVEGVVACRGAAAVNDIVDALVAGHDVSAVVGGDALTFLAGCPAPPGDQERASSPESR